MIPRAVQRIFDHRSEQRVVPTADHAVLGYRGTETAVTVMNVSRSGAMIRFAGTLNIGERVRLQIVDKRPVQGFVRWVRDDCMGLNFDTPLD